MSTVSFDVDQSDLDRYLASGGLAIGRLVDELAEELKRDLVDESASASKRIADAWEIATVGADRAVFLPKDPKGPRDVFFAPFLARGTRGHGPKNASRLVFAIDGNVVSVRHVAGVRANPFDERAIAQAHAATGGIIDRLIATVA